MFPEVIRFNPANITLISYDLIPVVPMGPPTGLQILFGNPDASRRIVLFEKYKQYSYNGVGLFYMDFKYRE